MKLMMIAIPALLIGFVILLVSLLRSSKSDESKCESLYKAYKEKRSPSDYPSEFVEKYSANFAEVRHDAFMKNCLKVEAHNRDPNTSYSMGINLFSDWVSVVQNE